MCCGCLLYCQLGVMHGSLHCRHVGVPNQYFGGVARRASSGSPLSGMWCGRLFVSRGLAWWKCGSWALLCEQLLRLLGSLRLLLQWLRLLGVLRLQGGCCGCWMCWCFCRVYCCC